ncbi:MAG: flagellar export protein FliJ [Syntrophobacteraceae bacterium]
MPFRFRLKNLLRHREFKLGEARTAFAAAESLRMGIVTRIGLLIEKIRSEGERFEKEQEAGIDTGFYLYFKDYLANLERELLQLQRELQKAARESELRRQAMIECDKSVKVLENIETRDREAYDYQLARRDQKKMDEAAVLKDYRDRGPGGRREGK